jgi:hypothetical protein
VDLAHARDLRGETGSRASAASASGSAGRSSSRSRNAAASGSAPLSCALATRRCRSVASTWPCALAALIMARSTRPAAWSVTVCSGGIAALLPESLPIQVDTEEERAYLRALAGKLGLQAGGGSPASPSLGRAGGVSTQASRGGCAARCPASTLISIMYLHDPGCRASALERAQALPAQWHHPYLGRHGRDRGGETGWRRAGRSAGLATRPARRRPRQPRRPGCRSGLGAVGGLPVASALHQRVEHEAVLVDGSPQPGTKVDAYPIRPDDRTRLRPGVLLLGK